VAALGHEGAVVASVELSGGPHEDYRIGLPYGGPWREVVNTDAEVYGGSGVGNAGMVHADEILRHGLPYSALVRVPRSALWLTPEADRVSVRTRCRSRFAMTVAFCPRRRRDLARAPSSTRRPARVRQCAGHALLALCAYDDGVAPLAVTPGLPVAARSPVTLGRALRDRGAVAGFAMEAVDLADGSYWIGGLVVDAASQGRGLGRTIVALVECARAGGTPPSRCRTRRTTSPAACTSRSASSRPASRRTMSSSPVSTSPD
jgi:GNAT superfamily N-acetyltransferase